MEGNFVEGSMLFQPTENPLDADPFPKSVVPFRGLEGQGPLLSLSCPDKGFSPELFLDGCAELEL